MSYPNPVTETSHTTARRCHNFLFRSLSQSRFSWVILFLLLQSFAKAEAQETNYAVHANIIYHFTKYIDWPANKKTGDFVIGIIGETPLYEELNTSIAGKTAGGQKIVIRQYPSSASSFNCHILFISNEESNRLKKIILATADDPVLIVSEGAGLAEKGACINFKIVQERLKLEINKNSIEKRKLSIATELLQLGTVVN